MVNWSTPWFDDDHLCCYWEAYHLPAACCMGASHIPSWFLFLFTHSTTYYPNVTSESHTPSGNCEAQNSSNTCPYQGRSSETRIWHRGYHVSDMQCFSCLALLMYCSAQQEHNIPVIIAPQPVRTKGRPRNKRLTSATEAERPTKRVKLYHTSSTPRPAVCDASPSQQMTIIPPSSQTQSDGVGWRRCTNCGNFGHYAKTCVRLQERLLKLDSNTNTADGQWFLSFFGCSS
jgi:hypothetical protein